MAWTAPATATDGSVLTAAFLNAIRDNMNETAVAKATAAGQHFVSTAANALAARTPGVDSIATTETTTSTSFADLTSGTPGPSVTVTCGSKALVCIFSRVATNAAGGIGRVGFAVTGASSVSGDDDLALAFESDPSGQDLYASAVFIYSGLTTGSNTFKMVYKIGSGATTGTFASRRLSIVPW